MVHSVLILPTPFDEVAQEIASESSAAQTTLKSLRRVLLVTLSFHLVAYLVPVLLADIALGFVIVTVGYAIADITAKGGYGSIIHNVENMKTGHNISVAA